VTRPTAPIELAGTASRLAPAPALPAVFADRLAATCDTTTDVVAAADASRDWWPLSMHWALAGQVLQRAAIIARPTSTEQVAAVLAACHEEHVPVTAAGGRSGVLGASVPVFGGVLLDLTGMQGIASVDVESGLVEVLAAVRVVEVLRARRLVTLDVVAHNRTSLSAMRFSRRSWNSEKMIVITQ